jgi:anaerobic magnesium-protoporphyrin IX monomethyl ester cyclase
MATLWHSENGPCLFCFHDDTLLLPRPADSLARLTELRRGLDEFGVGEVGLIGKCRPDNVTRELARGLARLGVVRLFVGVENAAQRGLDHLGRRTCVADLERAFGALGEAGIFICYNLLLFEPDCVLDDVRENIAFIRRHPTTPIDFCRAEAYHGTPLHARVRARAGRCLATISAGTTGYTTTAPSCYFRSQPVPSASAITIPPASRTASSDT